MATDGSSATEQIIDTPVGAEMRQSFLEYAMSTIVARALPDVRDGLKPVHRRIVYSMFRQGVRPDTPHMKSARIVGNVLGKYHPHGDAAVYLTMVRAAQPWSMRMPLVDGHGNFGSLGGEDPPAAARYTEARMSPGAVEMIGEIDEDTVEFVDNYDGRETEPSVLPAKVPALLVNGAAGIAVGLRTSIPPHNLAEVAAACKLLLADPDTDLDRLLEVLPGPDFPTGGIVVGGTDAVRECYQTGAGRFTLRARTEIVTEGRRQQIVITELPYTIGPEAILAKMKKLLNDKKLDGISIADTKNLTDRKSGLKLVIGVKSGFDPTKVLAQLLRHTELQTTFSYNAVALVDGRPATLDLRSMLRHYLDHRTTMVTRRSQHRLAKAQARAHLIEGLLVALDAIDEVVATIRRSKTTDTARRNLMRTFKLTEIQATHLLEMPLRRLTSMEVSKLREELAELRTTIASLTALLADDTKIAQTVADELDQVTAELADARRSQLAAEAAATLPTLDDPAELETADEPCTVTLSSTGLLGRAAGEARHTGKHLTHDVVLSRLVTTTRSDVYAVTAAGRLHRCQASEIPEIAGRSRGSDVAQLLTLEPGDEVVALVGLHTDAGIVLATRDGAVKRLTGDAAGVNTRGGVKDGVSVLSFKTDTDRCVAAYDLPDDDTGVVLVTSEGKLLRFDAASVRPQGRTGGGVTGIKLPDATTVLTAGHDQDTNVTVCTDAGNVKTTPVAAYPTKGRATGGVRAINLRKDDRSVTAATVAPGAHLGVAASGAVHQLPETTEKRDASGQPTDPATVAVGPAR